MNDQIYYIINYLHEKRGFNLSCYNRSFIERRLDERLIETGSSNYIDYLERLKNQPEEITCLLDKLSVNVSQFFRNNITFEILSEKIFPSLIDEKMKTNDNSLRIWSAGCANGEEPYSIAILLKELLSGENPQLNLSIFGTDIDKKAIEKAREGIYPFEMIKEIKYGLLRKYFVREKDSFKIIPEIKNLIAFSLYDLTDGKSYAPPESVFGSFDMVICRNVLIYFNAEYQEIILKKAYRSLAKNGFLVLGEYEEPVINSRKLFKKYNEFIHIYQKQGSEGNK